MKPKMEQVLTEVLKDESDAVRQIIHGVLAVEVSKIDLANPAGIQKDVQRVIDEQVRREEGRK